MKRTILIFALGVVALSVFGTDGDNAFGQQKKGPAPPAAPFRRPNPVNAGMSRWKLQEDIQTRIFAIGQDVNQTRAKTSDKAFNQQFPLPDRRIPVTPKGIPGTRRTR